jgi:hypothetical protein
MAFVSQISATTYDITFPDQSGNTAGTGSFDYVASNPIGNQFSDFLVSWDGFTFDLTQSANSPQVLVNQGGQYGNYFQSPDSAGVFEALEVPENCDPRTYWFGGDIAADQYQEFHLFIVDNYNIRTSHSRAGQHPGAPLVSL